MAGGGVIGDGAAHGTADVGGERAEGMTIVAADIIGGASENVAGWARFGTANAGIGRGGGGELGGGVVGSAEA